MPFLPRNFAARTVLCLFAPFTLAAQSATGASAIDDSVALRSNTSASRWAQRGWISTGLGAGTSWRYRSLALIAEGWYSAGPLVAGARLGGAGPADFRYTPRESRNDEAFLIGARTRRSRAFILGAFGVARVTSSSDLCVPGPCARFSPFNTTEAAYAVEAHTNLVFVGVGASMFGALGARSVRYNAFALTLDAGWFGR
jgi:hypothetical protein